MEPGNVVRLRTFRHYTGEQVGIQAMDFTAPTGKVFLLVLLGVEDKDKAGSVNPNELLTGLGWKFEASG